MEIQEHAGQENSRTGRGVKPGTGKAGKLKLETGKDRERQLKESEMIANTGQLIL
jgi:hypothetical protein